MAGRYVEDWTNLAGRTISVRRGGRLIRVGLVDAVTPDGDMLWLQSEGVEPRALFHKADHYTAWTVQVSAIHEPIDHFLLDNTRVPAAQTVQLLPHE